MSPLWSRFYDLGSVVLPSVVGLPVRVVCTVGALRALGRFAGPGWPGHVLRSGVT